MCNSYCINQFTTVGASEKAWVIDANSRINLKPVFKQLQGNQWKTKLFNKLINFKAIFFSGYYHNIIIYFRALSAPI